MKIALALNLVAPYATTQIAATGGAAAENLWLWGDSSELQWGDSTFIRIF